jgi:group I intron endonuclease
MKVIYKITCTANGKFYIGSTVNKTQRWARHRKDLRSGTHPNKNMLASWIKYGEESFVFEVVEVVQDDVLLFAAEQKHLDQHAGKDYCFNWSRHADAPMRGRSGEGTPNYGRKFGQDFRDKVSSAVAGENHPNWGKNLSSTTKQKISEANKTNPWKGSKHTDEAKAKISQAGKGRVVSEETRAKRSAALKGREIPLEQRIRTSKTLSGEGNYWYGKKRPEHGVKVSRPVMAIDPAGNVATYPSITAMRQALGLTPTTVNRAVKDGVPLTRGKNAGWAFKYIDPRSAVVA